MPGAIKFVDTVDGPAKSESPVENGGNTSHYFVSFWWCRISQSPTVCMDAYPVFTFPVNPLVHMERSATLECTSLKGGHLRKPQLTFKNHNVCC